MSKKNKREAKEQKPVSKRVKLKSRLNFPVTTTYDGEGLVIAPHGEVIIPNKSKLGTYPKGIFAIPLPA